MHIARRVAGLTVLVLALVPSGLASAQADDPEADSPSGVIYEIPLDNARKDAAPTGPGDGTAGAGAQGGSASPIRSENGFGSSSTVPGAVAGGSTAKKAPSGTRSDDDQERTASGTGGDGEGAQRQAGTPGSAAKAAAESLDGARSATVTPSKSRTYMLLALALLVAAGLGVAGRYVARRR
jgi:hypothetical protein